VNLVQKTEGIVATVRPVRDVQIVQVMVAAETAIVVQAIFVVMARVVVRVPTENVQIVKVDVAQ
jgi:hypothetical protein